MSAEHSPSQREQLLTLARQAIENRGRAPDGFRERVDPQLAEEERAAFVTLTRGSELRGCIGNLAPDAPLPETIVELAYSAATRDPRFPPVSAQELPGLHIEISVLTPPRDASPDEVEIGTHGLIIERGHRRGLLLPQVATEHHLSREEFLGAACQKAGLRPDAWRDPDTRLQTFTAEVFGERP